MRHLKEKCDKPMAKQGRLKPLKSFSADRVVLIRKIGVAAFYVLLAASLGAVGGLIARYGYKTATSSETFVVKEVEITGNNRIAKEEIIKISGVSRGTNIFSIDIERVAHSIQSHPWIDGVTVKRNYPDKVIIHVVERSAAAILRKDEMVVIDANGEAFKKFERGDPSDMPVITIAPDYASDKSTIECALDLLKQAEKSNLVSASEISEIVVGGAGMSVYLIHAPYLVKMNSTQVESEWDKMELVLADAQRSGAEVIGIDLRHKDGAAIRVKSGSRTLLAGQGKILP